jgi:hypothetical protein
MFRSTTTDNDNNKKVLSTNQLSNQVHTSIDQLETQLDDLRATQVRRELELQQTQEELQGQQRQVQQSGEALEYYQLLRERLANWVGALRQLRTKVTPIQYALHDLEAECTASQRQQDWEDDMILILRQYERLDQVLGRQPNPNIFETFNTFVDEFGRDVKSQAAMAREQRATLRRRIRQQRVTIRGDESDAWLSDDEKETMRERHDSLQRALQIAWNELDEEYTSLSNLFLMFQEWLKTYPEEYAQCYAALSLADLSSVLILAEMCSLNDPWDESKGYNAGKWIAMVHSARESAILDDAGTERILEKAVIPVLSDLLDRRGYNLVSTRQTIALSQFWKHLQRISSPNSVVLPNMNNRLVDYIKSHLDNVAIPIVHKSCTNLPPDLKDAMDGATVGQMHRIKKVLVDLIHYWAPILGHNDRFIQIVLDFLSNNFLYLLSSLQGFPQPRFQESPADVFRVVWSVLVKTTWLERPEWMLQAAPLRAAAAVYQL